MDALVLASFREVAERGSITAAAGALGYTQSAISRQVAALEAEVGAPLFDRLPRRGVRLTAAGEALLPHARAIVERAAGARAEIAAIGRAEGGRLRVGAFSTANAELVPRALAAFAGRHPRITSSLREGTTQRQLAALGGGELDVAVVSADPRRPLEAGAVRLDHLLDEPMLVAVPPGHRLASCRAVRLGALAGEPWIAGDETVRDPLRTLAPELVAEGAIRFVVRDWNAKHGLVAAGLGITLVPALACNAVGGRVALVPLHRDDGPARRVSIATPAGVTDPPAVAAFARHLREAAATMARELRDRGLHLPRGWR